MPRIKIGQKTYDAKPLEGLPLKHLLTFKADTAAIGMPSSWSELETASVEMQKLPDSEKLKHPQWELVYAAMIWATLLAHGENLRFADVLDIDLSTISWVEDAPVAPGPTKGSGKKSSPKVSAAAE